MKLAELTCPEVEAIDRDAVVVIPTGSLEQHGPHLPFFTDSLIVTAVARAAEAEVPDLVLLLPTLWLGASMHHLPFPGTLSASFETYNGAVTESIESLVPHGFHKFLILNGHGGNTSPNDIALRRLKSRLPNLSLGHVDYNRFAEDTALKTLSGPLQGIQHACEAEVSLMLHLHPELVRKEKLRDDGLVTDPPLLSPVLAFDEITEQGSYGYATFATAETGKRIFDACVAGVVAELRTLAQGYTLKGLPPV